jgi:hypothetical protein
MRRRPNLSPLKKGDDMPKVLVAVDVQKGFVSPSSEHVLKPIEAIQPFGVSSVIMAWRRAVTASSWPSRLAPMRLS